MQNFVIGYDPLLKDLRHGNTNLLTFENLSIKEKEKVRGEIFLISFPNGNRKKSERQIKNFDEGTNIRRINDKEIYISV